MEEEKTVKKDWKGLSVCAYVRMPGQTCHHAERGEASAPCEGSFIMIINKRDIPPAC